MSEARSAEPLVRADGLTVDLAEGRRIIDGVSFEVSPGECVGLVGESGSGKSITLRSVIGVPPAGARVGGTVELDGRSSTDLGSQGVSDWRATHLGMIFQDPRAVIDPTRPVGDYVGAVLRQRRVPSAERRAAVIAALQSVGVPEPESAVDRMPDAFSGGQLQRVVIAGALIGGPRLLVADEPTTALDTLTQARVVALLQQKRRSRDLAMLFVTHNLELALAICDRIVVLYAGKVVETVTPRQLRDGQGHPYTRALLGCKPDPDHRMATLPVVDDARAALEAEFASSAAVR